MTKPKLLIVNKTQFGCLVDVYKWCKYLKNYYDITVLCFDAGDEKQCMEGVKVVYVSSAGSFVVRGIRYILHCLWYILRFKGIILIEYFENCIWLKRVFPFRKMILDVRTIAVWGTQADRDRYDKCIECACDAYDVVSVISEGVRRRLHRDCNTFILPLGADVISVTDKTIDAIRLLYVGTLAGRRIDITIRAVAAFHGQHPEIPLHYDVVGDGYHQELEQCRNLVKSLDTEDIITLHGRIPNTQLQPFFDKANIGVSFVPITGYYDIQPPTKTFEYTLSGIYTLATRTSENAAVINSNCGYLTDDTEAGFIEALEYVWHNRAGIDSAKVRGEMMDHRWELIVSRDLLRILKNF